MSSKVIKWFKRQASIRRHSDKPEEKSSSSNTKSEEKRKTSFPRLSFRKRNKRKGSDLGGGLSIVGISKKFSFSVPKEMESHTKENPNDSRVPTSQSTNCCGSVSLTNSPSKTVEYQSVSSEESNQSSFDNSKENTVSEFNEENFKTEHNKSGSESISRTSNFPNQLSIHCISTGSKSNSSLNNFYDNTKQESAPIVKMEEICDSYSDKEHPEETQSNVAYDMSISNISNSCKEEFEDSVSNNKNNNYGLYDNLNLELTKLKCEETVLYIEEELISKEAYTETKEEEKHLKNVFEEIDRLVKDAASIAEVDTNLSNNSNESFSNDQEIDAGCNVEVEETEGSEEFHQTNESSNTETDENYGNSDTTDIVKDVEMKKEEMELKNEGESKLSENIIEHNSRNSSEDISTLSIDDFSLSHLPANSCNDNDKILSEEQTPLSDSDNRVAQNLEDINGNSQAINKIYEAKSNSEEIEESTKLESETHENKINEEFEKEIELKITEESDFNETESTKISGTSVSDLTKEGSCTERDDEKSVISPVQITFTHPSPVRKKEPQKLIEEKNLKSPDYYPKDLNPFSDDEEESDSFPEAIKFVPANNGNNFEVSPKEKNRSKVKENGFSSSQRETPENNFVPQRRMRSSSSSPQLKSSYRDREQLLKEYYDKSLNPFGESDDEDDGPSSLNSTNPFDEDEDLGSNPPSSGWRDPPPSLPPKSMDLQIKKNSRGFLPPIPHPRRSKQSHHGSYTSLQNVPTTVPIPAPRSITPFGSTKTLNYSLNPFDDDDDDQAGDFQRRGVGRSSLQALPVTSSPQEPLSRTSVRGSLPPSSKIKLNRKKRAAPLPPGFSPNKPSASPCYFGSLPRKRASISAFDVSRNERKYSSSSRDESPQRMPPPRPPPPKYN